MGFLVAKGPGALGSGEPEGLQIKDQQKNGPRNVGFNIICGQREFFFVILIFIWKSVFFLILYFFVFDPSSFFGRCGRGDLTFLRLGTSWAATGRSYFFQVRRRERTF